MNRSLIRLTSAASFILAVSVALADDNSVGKKVDQGTLDGRSGNVYHQAIPEMRLVNLDVTGDGDGDIDCWVYAPTGRKVGEDTSISDGCNISFFSFESGMYNIQVMNTGEKSTMFQLTLKWSIASGA